MPVFACRFRSFVIMRAELDAPLKPPLKLLANGHLVEKPYLGVPLTGTQSFFLVVRPSIPLPKTAHLRLQDAAGTCLDWKMSSRTDTPAAWNKNVTPADSLKLLGNLIKNFGTLFGAQHEDFWRELIDRIAGRIETATVPLAAGRSYFRIRHHRPVTNPELVPLQFLQAGETGHRTDSVGLLDKDYLHGFISPDHGREVDDQYWIVQWEDAACLPLILKAAPKDAPVADAHGAILELNPDAPPALGDYLPKIGGIKPPLSEPDQALAEGLRSRITGLEGMTLTGWAIDVNRPGEHISVGISWNGKSLGTACADLPMVGRGGGEPTGNHGFTFVLPAKLLDGEEHTLRLTLPGRPDYATGQAFKIGRGHFDGGYRLEGGRSIAGWLRERCSDRQAVSLPLELEGVAASRCRLSPSPKEHGDEFRIELPHWLQDGSAHEGRITVHRDGREIAELGEPFSYQARYRGALVKLDAALAAGWIVNERAPDLPVTLDLYVNGAKDFTAETKPVRDRNGRSVFGFTFYLDVPKPGERYRSFEFFIAGTRHRVLGPARILTPVDSILGSLTEAAGLLRSADPDERTHEWVRRQVLAPLIGELRKAGALPASLTLNFAPVIQSLDRRPAGDIIDVVVPVHSGLQQTLDCLDSLEAANAGGFCEIVVINDCSPEPELSERLRERAAAGRITLIENPRNLGFVASANRGLRLHPERDVILLNSDTVVPPQWAERLRRVAHGNGAIGTVTPLSNNATICSFPRPNADNPLPAGWSAEELDRALQQANGDGCHDLPTAVGYCMYIKRQLMDEIGYLDEHEWGKGYAEENDFCLRGAALGWRHVSADGVFVLHHGSVSFGDDKSPLLAANLAKLYRLYPDYPATVQRFVADDPLAKARNPVIQRLLRRHAGHYLLFVSHELGGGTQVAIDDLCRGLAAEGQAVLELRSQPDGKWRLQAHGTDYAAIYRPADYDRLAADLRDLAVWHIHYHQIPFFPRRITELPEHLGLAYDVTVHDYLAICPRINMMDETGFYCGDSQYDPAICNRCIAALGPEEGVEALYAEHGEDVAAWRSHHREFLSRARRVFLPSKAVAQLLKPHLTLANAVVQPHSEPAFRLKPAEAAEQPIVKVAVIGAIGAHKGYDLLLACARTACKDGLPLHFVVIGYTQDDAAFDRLDNVTITGPYRREDLDGLLEQHGCQVAAFFSPWPETYCYALTEAWRAGLYPVALDLGAQAERIRMAGYGDVLPVTADPKRINRGLSEGAKHAALPAKRATIGKSYRSMLADYYGLEAPAVPKPAVRSRKKTGG